MVFKKGELAKNWNGFKNGHPFGKRFKKGIHHSPKTEFKKGLGPWNKGTIGLMPKPWNKGKKMSEDTKQKMREGYKYHSPTKKSLKNLEKGFTKKSRALLIFPKKDTTIEVKIQNFLKQLGIDFFTHQYIKEIEHSYQCDILIPSINLVIECDGDYWHKYPVGNDIDHIRTKELIEKGFKVLRLWEFEIRKMEVNDFKNIINKSGGI